MLILSQNDGFIKFKVYRKPTGKYLDFRGNNPVTDKNIAILTLLMFEGNL